MIRALIHAVVLCGATALHAGMDVQTIQSPKGITAWLVEEPEIPFVALEIRFRGGTSLDPAGQEGATNLMVGLLEEGAADMDARAFAQRTEELAASFSYDAGRDAVAISARFLSENADEAIDLLRESLINPTFPEDAIDRVRKQVEAAIKSAAKTPNKIARRAFYEAAFAGHPYARPSDGTQESIAALTRADIQAVHQGVLSRDHLYVSAVGDVSAADLGAMLDRLFEGLPEQGFALPKEAAYQLPPGVYVTEFPTPQSVALFGHEGIKRDDPDFFAAYVMNQILGAGGFESRLMDEVREKRGLTYGIYSYLMGLDHAAIYAGSVASANDRIVETIDVVRAEWAKMAENGVTQAELTRAKTYLTGAYPLRFDGNGPIANILVGMQMDGLSPEYIKTRNDRINAVSLADVKRVAARILHPEALHFTVVGQPEGLE